MVITVDDRHIDLSFSLLYSIVRARYILPTRQHVPRQCRLWLETSAFASLIHLVRQNNSSQFGNQIKYDWSNVIHIFKMENVILLTSFHPPNIV